MCTKNSGEKDAGLNMDRVSAKGNGEKDVGCNRER